MQIRIALSDDLPAITELVEQRRLQYQDYQPTFWRKAKDSAQKMQPFLAGFLDNQDTVFTVIETQGELLGFLIATKINAPPVYDPGGPTYQIDDFCIADASLWSSAGKTLLNHALIELKRKEAAQIVIVCGDRDLPKAEMLREMGLTIASNWWTKPL